MRTKGEDCKGGKRSKERITVTLLCNQTGEFEKPIVIGRCTNPRSFKNVKTSSHNFPVTWHWNKNARMTSDIFEIEMKLFNEKMRRKDRNGIVFLDNATCHRNMSSLSNVNLVFLPPNTTSHLQPLDQGIIKTMKTLYRKKLLTKNLAEFDKGNDVSNVNECVTVLDAVYWKMFPEMWIF
jgi:hypothetical protein